MVHERINAIYTSFTQRYSEERFEGLGSFFRWRFINRSKLRKMREEYIKIGIEEAMIELSPTFNFERLQEHPDRIKNENRRKFAYAFNRLVKEYQCGIEYHQQKGLIIYDLEDAWKSHYLSSVE